MENEIEIEKEELLPEEEDGTTELLPITGYEETSSVDKITSLIERSPDILSRIKNVFTKKKKKDESGDDISVEDTATAGTDEGK